MCRALRTRALPPLVIAGILATLAAACGSSSSTSTPTAAAQTPTASAIATASASPSSPPASATTNTGGETVQLEITAKDNKFDKTTLTVKAGQKVTLVFHNEDKIPHNFSLFTTRGGTPLYTGDYISGPSTQDVTFTAPAKPGNYYFECEIHPDTMNGAFVVQ